MKYVLTALMMMLTLSACSEQSSLQEEFSAKPQKKSTDIIGGIDVDPSDAHIEYTVFIVGKYANGETYSCSGTLIDEDIILTAAHCLGTKESMRMTFGENPLHDGPVEVFKVKEVLGHDKFNQTETVRNDIALILMDRKAPEFFAPAVLPWAALKPVRNFSTVRVYGFGTNSGILQNGKTDKASVGILRTAQVSLIEKNTDEDIFTANQRQGQGICSGDSGGPAFIRNNVVVGVISRAITDDPLQPEAMDNDICNYQSVFTKVSYYQKWIIEGIEKLQQAKNLADKATPAF